MIRNRDYQRVCQEALSEYDSNFLRWIYFIKNLSRLQKRSDIKRRRKWRKKSRGRHPYCSYCNINLYTTTPTVDHFIPLSKGGLDIKSNYRLSCEACNSYKSNKPPKTFLRSDWLRRRREKVYS